MLSVNSGRPLTRNETIGLGFLSGFGALSLLAVIFVVGILATTGIRMSRSDRKNVYPMTHLVVFFGSLMFSNALQAIGNVMNLSWVVQSGPHNGIFCSTQGAIKQFSNLGVCLWSLVLSIHAFTILFLRWKPRQWTAFVTFFVVWSFIVLAVILPGFVLNDHRIPYFGVAGYWCWITPQHQLSRILLEYLWMYISGVGSLILYALTVLRLRGNLLVSGWKISFHWVGAAEAWQLQSVRDLVDTQMLKVTSHMLWYPAIFTIMIIPITIVRAIEFAGSTSPFEFTIFSATVFTLNGFVNALLLLSARKLLPDQEALPTLNMKRVTPTSSSNGIVPYILPPKMELTRDHTPTDLSRQNSSSTIHSTTVLVPK